MQLKITALAVLTAISATVLASPSAMTAKVTYDETYDNPNGPLNDVACSDGANGMLTKGFSTFGSLPHFPNIGGAAAIAGWNSASCGTCWRLTYNGRSINVLAVDSSGWNTFNIGRTAMDELTNGRAVELGGVSVYYSQVNDWECNRS